ncbi:PH domain-containing protein [Halovivax sp.]|uniref:PH domain-containing protein n=1 Tax=Halovivax sp. TaxID=1935978 RepID=UPI0025B88530|nr:PH domain-containing protein [Halovivax sp.]
MPLDGDEYDWLHLSEGERVVWASRPHPIELGRGFILAVLVALLGGAIAAWNWPGELWALRWVGVLVLAAGVALAAIRFLFWTNTRYVITSEELYEKRGVVSRDVTQFKMDRVQNTTLRQSVAGRVLGFGDLTVYTAGSGDPELTFTRVPDPGEANAALSRQLGRNEHSNPRSTP